MKTCTIVPHTADIALRIEASTLEELFECALLGMTSIIRKGFCREEAPYPLAETISIVSFDQSSLLIDFLNEVLALTHESKAVFCKVGFASLSDSSLEAEVFGGKVDGFDEDIKAATYHGALIETNDRGYLEVTVLFDI